MNPPRRVLPALLLLGLVLGSAASGRADDKTADVSKLHGKWIFQTQTKSVDGDEREIQLRNSYVSFTAEGMFSRYMFAGDRIVGHKGTYRVNKGGSLYLEHDGGKFGPYKFSLSDDGQQLTLVSKEEGTYKLKFKEE